MERRGHNGYVMRISTLPCLSVAVGNPWLTQRRYTAGRESWRDSTRSEVVGLGVGGEWGALRHPSSQNMAFGVVEGPEINTQYGNMTAW